MLDLETQALYESKEKTLGQAYKTIQQESPSVYELIFSLQKFLFPEQELLPDYEKPDPFQQARLKGKSTTSKASNIGLSLF